MSRPLSLGLLSASLLLILVALGALVFLSFGDDTAPASNPTSASPSTTPPDSATPSKSAVPHASPTGVAGILPPSGTATGPAEHEGPRALAHVNELAKEPRVSGTAAESRAAQYIGAQFASFGYVAEVMEFEFEGDRFRAGEVTLDGRTIEALTLAGSPGGKASATAVYIGLADQTGISGKDIKGKMAVADRGTLNFSEKYQNAKDAGAIGLIVVNNRPGPFSGNLTTLAEFPVVGVSQEDGAAVLEAAKAGGRTIAIDAPPTVGNTKALNVIAKPTPESTCQVVVGGHFDSVPGAPGANDNASGTANVIELARATAADGLDEGLCFAAFGAEESGLYGSEALIARFEEDGILPRFMLNLDVTGIGNGVEVIGSSQAAKDALRIAKAAGIPAVPSSLPANSGSDHESFANAGVEVVFLTSGDFGTIHSPQDVSGDIEVEALDWVGDAGLLVINNLLAVVARG